MLKLTFHSTTSHSFATICTQKSFLFSFLLFRFFVLHIVTNKDLELTDELRWVQVIKDLGYNLQYLFAGAESELPHLYRCSGQVVGTTPLKQPETTEIVLTGGSIPSASFFT